MAGAVCVIGSLGGLIHICEGIADALAIAAREEGAAIAAGGTGGFPALARGPLLSPLFLWPDGDAKGREAADALAEALRRRGAVVRIAAVPNGEDPASLAGPFPTSREPI